MQIKRTEIAAAVASTGEHVVRVLFFGEGGDCVTVDMARTEPHDHAATLNRARAILVQTATFGLADNDYDAESNGNFDEVGLTAVEAENSDVYVFEYRDGNRSERVPPSTMPSVAAAREEALRCAVELLEDLQQGQDELAGWLVRVRSEDGKLLFDIDVQEAIRNRPRA